MVTIAHETESRGGSQRRVLWLLVRRDLRLRYSGAALGYGWTVLEPLLMTLVYALVFGVLLPARKIAETPYMLFLVVGVLSWNWFQSALVEGCRSLSGEAKIVRTANVPRTVWVARTVIAKMLEFIFALPIVVLIIVFYRHPVHWQIVLFPLGLIMQVVLCYGFGLLLAPLTVIADDVVRIVRIALRVGFYLTPVLYSLNNLGAADGYGWLAEVAKFTPMAAILTLYRAGLWPQDLYTWPVYVVTSVMTIVILLLGRVVFTRLEGTVLKEI